MAKFCKIAGKVTNCTDNCKACLEEEANTRDIKVGDKVRYTTEDIDEVKESGYFPPKGTTKPDRCWYVSRGDIELA